MKKAYKRIKSGREPAAAALREMPEVDFEKAKLRRNPYAKEIARKGIEICLPGRASRRLHIQSGNGRPVKAAELEKTIPGSVRFPDSIWLELEKRAAKQGRTLHSVLREAILTWLGKAV